MQIEERRKSKILDVILVSLKWCNYLKLRRQHKIKRKLIYTNEEVQVRGFFAEAYKIVINKNDEQFRKIAGMSVSCFNMLFQLLQAKLTKLSPRRPVEAECRLILTLMLSIYKNERSFYLNSMNEFCRCLKQGSKYSVLAKKFLMGVSTVRVIMMDTLYHVWNELNSIYLKMPNKGKWETIANDFLNKSRLPHCIGAIDAKHITLKCPPKGHSLNYKYEKSYSVILVAACDSNHFITAVDVGPYGLEPEKGILQSAGFINQLCSGLMDLPKKHFLPNSNIACPYYFVADSTFPLRKNIMKPYTEGITLNRNEFNNILTNTKAKIDNTFGIIAARWKILQGPLKCNPKNAENIIKSIVVLHNFLKTYDREYCPHNFVDSFHTDCFKEGLWRKEGKPLPQCKLFKSFEADKEAIAIRENLNGYISSYNLYIEDVRRKND